MVKITKDQALYLVKKEGLKFHQQVFKTYSGHPTYYCMDRPWVLDKLKNYGK